MKKKTVVAYSLNSFSILDSNKYKYKYTNEDGVLNISNSTHIVMKSKKRFTIISDATTDAPFISNGDIIMSKVSTHGNHTIMVTKSLIIVMF